MKCNLKNLLDRKSVRKKTFCTVCVLQVRRNEIEISTYKTT